MKSRILSALIIVSGIFAVCSNAWSQTVAVNEEKMYRPQVHFSPLKNWVNDPNGMVYYNGTYHLFYQHHPYSSVWGPMHWGHATSKDLVHWKREPIAIYPDSIGTIFSGSAVADLNNTSGFGKNGKIPLVAIFTQHNPDKEKARAKDVQNQSIAFSLDDGKTWTKYKGNPVLKSPGIPDFRDPKVMWYEPAKKWIMCLAVQNHISFYSSPDLKTWTKESDFGQNAGAHGGVWECPDMFPLEFKGKQFWVLLVNLNPGGPNKGSATQYFVGQFDGNKFIADHTDTRWMDYGPDNYAGVTWSNTGKRKILIGWMSNWIYANQVPTSGWRNAMTLPRDLSLKQAGDKLLLASVPVKELAGIKLNKKTLPPLTINGKTDITSKIQALQIPCQLNLQLNELNDFSLTLSNEAGEKLVIGFEKDQNQFFIDRSNAGQHSFNEGFAARHFAPRFASGKQLAVTLVIDKSSVELFADGGLTVMTELFFPTKPYTHLYAASNEKVLINKLEYTRLKSTW